ncbi:MAG: hypothetical protein KatS3mg125_0480 [Lysobacterales bacterium]|jgi:energy-coupling factor transporter ATP-binding protein EcfA2|nr:MAG: hypothetical protein KatS3mg125_0480 [Xanthomonadales bacterium]
MKNRNEISDAEFDALCDILLQRTRRTEGDGREAGGADEAACAAAQEAASKRMVRVIAPDDFERFDARERQVPRGEPSRSILSEEPSNARGALLKKLRAEHGERKDEAFLREFRLPGQAELDKLDAYRRELPDPDAARVLEFISGKLRIIRHAKDIGPKLRLPPILLVGPPGCGKTQLALSIGQILALPTVFISVEQLQDVGVLAGTSQIYSNTMPGRVFSELVLGEVANPLFIVDEVDKLPGSSTRGDPRGVLSTLLEAQTAQRAQDAAFDGLLFDASHIFWIGTANALDPIPEHLLSRFLVFEVGPGVAANPAAQLKLLQKVIAEKERDFRYQIAVECEEKIHRSLRGLQRGLPRLDYRILRAIFEYACDLALLRAIEQGAQKAELSARDLQKAASLWVEARESDFAASTLLH